MFALFVLAFGSKSQIDKRMLFQIESGKVALISGGGSGHEPFCAGYIGMIYGLLVNFLVFWLANF